MSKFLIADPVHIHTRNFGSLFDYLTEKKATVITNSEHQNMMSTFGDYTDFFQDLFVHYETLETLSPEELFNFSVMQVNLFKVARAEILSLVITSDDMKSRPLPRNPRELFELLLENHRKTLLWNLAAAVHWINFWAVMLKKHNPKFALVFSGSLIYARSLLEVSRTHSARTFVLESFFTGNDNYIEEKYEPIANNSNLKHLAYYRSMEPTLTPDERDRERNKALNKVISSKNKNVNQPEITKVKLFKNHKNTILITGQVLNDFSVLEYDGIGINSVDFYQQLISALLARTDLNIIFKAHPWERKKKNITTALTLDTLCSKFEATPNVVTDSERLIFIEDFNIKSLFNQVNFVAGINSQALIEAAFDGYQPIQFGNAFYGKKGFTSDYSIDQIEQFIDDLNAGLIPTHLGIQEYRDFETFIVRALQFSLVSAFPSGKAQLNKIFKLPAHVPVLKGPPVTEAANGTPAAKPVVSPAAKPASPAKAATSAKAAAPAKLAAPASLKSDTQSKAEAQTKSKKKWQKFWKTPKKFFRDSKNNRIRWLHIFFPNNLSFSGKG